MGNEDYGESSRKNENNDDERPLKKARYVWEVKGKYHLKSTCQSSDNVDETNPSSINDDQEKENENENLNNNVALNNNNEPFTNRCCIESLLAKSEAILDSDAILDSEAILESEAILDSDDEEVAAHLQRAVNNRPSISRVPPKLFNQDYHLRKWQVRQMAKGFMDNSINSVIETWMGSPFDPTDLIDYCDNDGFVEDEGILMAIQSHGLQSNIDDEDQDDTNNSNENQRESSVSLVRPQAIVESTFDNFENVQNELIKSSMTSSSSSASESSECNNDDMICESSINQNIDDNISMDMNNPTDFLNAAVSVAIQKKGLSSYSY